MTKYELRKALSNGVINSTEYNNLIMELLKKEQENSRNYPRYTDSKVKENTRGFSKAPKAMKQQGSF